MPKKTPQSLRYELYYTFSSDDQLNISSSEKKKMFLFFDNLHDLDAEIPAMLILEHVKIEGLKIEKDNLPYGLRQTERLHVTYKKLPKKLQLVLYKFYKVRVPEA